MRLEPHVDEMDPGRGAAQDACSRASRRCLERVEEPHLQLDADAEGTEGMQEKRQDRYPDVICCRVNQELGG